jgi:hypothetical protein
MPPPTALRGRRPAGTEGTRTGAQFMGFRGGKAATPSPWRTVLAQRGQDLAKTSRKCALHPPLPPSVRCTCHAPVRTGDRCDSGFGSGARATARAPFIRCRLLALGACHTFRRAPMAASRRGSKSNVSRASTSGTDATRPTTPVPSAFLCEITRYAEGTPALLLGSMPICGRGCLGQASSKQVCQQWFVAHPPRRCGVCVRLFG